MKMFEKNGKVNERRRRSLKYANDVHSLDGRWIGRCRVSQSARTCRRCQWAVISVHLIIWRNRQSFFPPKRRRSPPHDFFSFKLFHSNRHETHLIKRLIHQGNCCLWCSIQFVQWQYPIKIWATFDFEFLFEKV